MDKAEKRNDESAEEKELLDQMDKQLSPRRSMVRIFIAIFAFIWFLQGVQPKLFYHYLVVDWV